MRRIMDCRVLGGTSTQVTVREQFRKIDRRVVWRAVWGAGAGAVLGFCLGLFKVLVTGADAFLFD